MATNQNNMGFVTGRLARDPQKFGPNKDGSISVRFTIMAQNNYKGKDGKRGVTAVPIEALITKPGDNGSVGVYDLIHKGDLVSVEYTITANNYKDKNGNDIYGINLLARGIELRESKRVTDARLARNAEDFIPDDDADVPFSESEEA